jgi:hypothetical protein
MVYRIAIVNGEMQYRSIKNKLQAGLRGKVKAAEQRARASEVNASCGQRKIGRNERANASGREWLDGFRPIDFSAASPMGRIRQSLRENPLFFIPAAWESHFCPAGETWQSAGHRHRRFTAREQL